MTPRGKAYVAGTSVALLLLIGIGIASAKDKPKSDACPDGMMPNPKLGELRKVMEAAGNSEEDIVATLAKLPQCVPVTCPEGYHRAPNGDCVKNTPEDPDPGFDPYDPGADKCPDGMRWSVHDRKCVPICGPDEFYSSAADACVPKPDPGGGDIDDILKPYPQPGAFYQVKKGDLFFGTHLGGANGPNSICYYALRRAAFQAAKLYGDNLSDTAAMAVVNANASTLKHEIHSLRPYLEIIGCGWWNDGVNASYRYAAGKVTKNPQTGRGIELDPQMAPNLDRMRAGQAPARNVIVGHPADQGKGPAYGTNKTWRSYPLLWIPEIDLKVFWDSGFKTITAEGVVYDDGSSRANPPPWVQIRGIDDVTGTLFPGMQLGCGVSQKAMT